MFKSKWCHALSGQLSGFSPGQLVLSLLHLKENSAQLQVEVVGPLQLPLVQLPHILPHHQCHHAAGSIFWFKRIFPPPILVQRTFPPPPPPRKKKKCFSLTFHALHMYLPLFSKLSHLFYSFNFCLPSSFLFLPFSFTFSPCIHSFSYFPRIDLR
jgi:hypothetical protein